MIIKKFEEQVEKFAVKEAVITESMRLTYGELNAYANRVANTILGIDRRLERNKNGQIVSLLFGHNALMIVGVLGTLKAGKAYVPLDVTYPENRLIYMLENSQSYLVLTDSQNIPLAETLAAEVDAARRPEIVNIDDITVDSGVSSENIRRNPSGDALAYILYTSGSTGRPKGVFQDLKNVYYYIKNWTERFSITSADRMTLFSAFSHDGAGQDMFGALLNGAVLYPYNILNRPNIAELAAWLIREKITIWHSVPTLYRYFINTLTDEDTGKFTDLRYILLGGEAVRDHDIQVFQRFFPYSILANVYGQTESSVNSIWQIKPGDVVKRMLIGEPLDRTDIFLVDDKDEIIEDLGVGEIIVNCEHIAPGYWQDKKAGEGVFSHDPDLGKLYCTGDLGRLLADGSIEFMGRKDSQVKIRGFRVEVGEIETRLLKHEAVKEAVIVPTEDEDNMVYLCAYVVLNNPEPVTGEAVTFNVSDMRSYLAPELPEYMIPSYLVQLEKLPLTPNGKVDRKRLPEPGRLRPQTGAAYAAPQTGMEKELTDIWKEILKLDKVGINDNFFDLGGTSFGILKLMRRIHEVFNRDIPVVSIFRYPTIRALLEYLKQGEKGEGALKTRKRTLAPAVSPIAVIGMAGRFPGAENLDEFWDNLEKGVESISFFSARELEQGGAEPQLFQSPGYVNAYGVLGGVDYFDAAFFNYSPNEADMMDPQLRLLHECSWEALEDAGYNPDTYDGLIGIYAGNAPNQYWVALTYFNQRQSDSLDTLFLNNNYTTKVSYKLNLKGPSVIVQTACSTSLVAIHFGCRGLIDRECDMALAGGVSITLPDKEGYLYREGMILSTDGHCRTFDANAGGTIFGNGVGMVVLKRLEDALADGDPIDAVIKGSAINNDGNRKVGITAPSVEGQAEAIAAALQVAGVEPESIGYIEAHGTGTVLGDPVEIEALNLAFGSGDGKNAKGVCAVGSVKTNVGHLNAAAGAAGFIKAVLALKHRTLPPTLHFETLNPKIDFENSPFYINPRLNQWNNRGNPLRAGVSSFGIGGTNAHVILEECPGMCRGEPPCSPGDVRKYQLILLSAKTQSALEKTTGNFVDYLKQYPAVNLADAAYTLQVGRKAFKYRRMFVCSQPHELEALLAAPAAAVEEDSKGVVFMFSGQGTQYINMGLNLYRGEPVFREAMDQCFEIVKPLIDYDLKEILYPQKGATPPDINQTGITQPIVFIFEYALAKLLMDWGIQPTAMIGYSLGEYVAACISGVFSLEDALKVVVTRGDLIKETPAGSLLSVPLPEKEIKSLLNNYDNISLSIINDPTCIVAGTPGAIETFEKEMKNQRLICGRVNMAHAVHSPLMSPVREKFEKKFSEVTLNPPRIPYLSNVSGEWIRAEEAVNPGYWGQHLCSTARFSDGIKELLKEDNTVFIEIGPGRVLGNLVRQHTDNKPGQMVLNVIRHQEEKVDDHYYLLKKIGQLWLYGITIDWTGFYGKERRHRIHLPTYPFEGQFHWLEENLPVPFAVSKDSSKAKNSEKTGPDLVNRSRPELSTVYASPETETEQILVTIWEELLGISRVGIHDNFFELGGDSLKAVTFAGRIHRETDTEVPQPEFFSRPTIRLLAEYIDKKEEKSTFYFISPVERKEYYTLSPAQKRLYILQQMDKTGTGYNIPFAVIMKGNLDKERLEKTLKQMITRHETLRTSFAMINGQVVQRIHDSRDVKFDIKYRGIEKGGKKDVDTTVETVLRDFSSPFDLSHPPLFRPGLIKIEDQKHIFMMDIHHIIFDGNSISVFFNDFIKIYTGEELSLLKLHYKDYSEWQRDRTQQEAKERQETYWVDLFAGEIPVIHLPADFARPPVQSFAGQRLSFTIDKEETGILKEIAANESATLFMVLLALFNVLLMKISGQEDIVVGTPVSGRRHTDSGNIIGIFINTLALRSYPGGQKTFGEFLAEVKARTLDAFDNQDYQFDELVEKLDVPRDLSRNPLFDVLFRLHNFEIPGAGIEEMHADGLKLQNYQYDPRTTLVDLNLTAAEANNRLLFFMEYCTKLFKEETIQRFIIYFKSIVSTLVKHPGLRLSRVDIITKKEKRQILHEFNDTAVDYPGDKTIHRLFAEQVDKAPDNIAAVGREVGAGARFIASSRADSLSLTYNELNRRSDRLSRRLKALGAASGTVVALITDRSVEMLIGLLAVLKADAAYLPVGPEYPEERVRYMLDHTGSEIIITSTSEIPFLLKPTVRILDAAAEAHYDTGEFFNSPGSAAPADFAYVIYTSGTTGVPKGVMIEHRAVVNFIKGITDIIPFAAADSILCLTTLSFDIFGLETILPLTKGSKVVIGTVEEQLNARAAAAVIEREHISILQVTPSRLQLLISQQEGVRSLESLTFLLVGGEAFPQSLLERVRSLTAGRIFNMYGPTETTIWSAVKEVTGQAALNIGKPIANTHIYIVGKSDHLQPVGIAGELCIAGHGLARGYFKNPKLTDEKFVTNPFISADDPGRSAYEKMYRTGDLACWLPDGNIEFLGRIDHQVKIRGFRIELEEIEKHLLDHDKIKETVVFIGEEVDNKYLCAYIVAAGELDAAALRDYLSRKLPDYMIPSHFVQLEKIPITSNGKIDRKALPKHEGHRLKAAATYVAPTAGIETTIADLWKEVLKLDKVGTNDNFFQLGGNSMNIIQLNTRIKEVLKKDVPVVAMFNYFTIRSFTTFLSTLDGGPEVAGQKSRRIEAINQSAKTYKNTIKRFKKGVKT